MRAVWFEEEALDGTLIMTDIKMKPSTRFKRYSFLATTIVVSNLTIGTGPFLFFFFLSNKDRGFGGLDINRCGLLYLTHKQ